MSSASKSPVTAVIVGAGHRAVGYASYALKHPDALRIVAVAEPLEHRRLQVARLHGLGPEQCFCSADELAAQPRLADAVINGTMDAQHLATALPTLRAGYHLLLEKPIATREADLLALRDAARQADRIVMICHVLRYAPFYVAIRRCLAEGRIGRLLSIQTAEHVSYHHMATAFVRGKWRNRQECGSPILMAKCCHDLDLVAWFHSGVTPVRVSSFGGRSLFTPANAPAGAGSRCLTDCAIEPDCRYSARRIHIERNLWGFYAWEGLEGLDGELNEARKLASLREDNPYGRCVWRCDNDVFDHQSVLVEFADGCVATHSLVGGAARGARYVHLVGTEGEIRGTMEDGTFTVRRGDPSRPELCEVETVDVSVTNDAHGGGDLRLVADFVARLRGQPASLSCTSLEDSIAGHLIGFRADESIQQGSTVALPAV